LRSGATSAVSILGYTPQYAPLEQIQGAAADPRSDLYALGATMYYLLTYAALIDAVTRASAVVGQQPDPLRPARELQPNIPAAVDAVLRQALALDIGGRPASAAAMRTALATALDMTRQATVRQPALERRTIPAPPAVTQVSPPAPVSTAAPGRRVSWPLPAAGGLAALLLVAAVVLFLNRPGGLPLLRLVSGATAATMPPIATGALIGATPLDPTAAPSEQAPSTTPSGLAVGQIALTRAAAVYMLWSAQSGGEHVNERPRLFGGAQVSILAIEPSAVQVRTAEGVEGWIHKPAEDALTADLSDTGTLRHFSPGTQVRVVWSRGIPVRVAPRSNASKLLDQLKAGQGGAVQEALGDWLKIELDDGSTGWVRWYYDGRVYVDLASRPAFQRKLLVQTDRLSGDDVRAVQERLSLLGYEPGTADGIYGPDTAAAVEHFQAGNKIEVDGIVGPQTWARLFSAEAVPSVGE